MQKFKVLKLAVSYAGPLAGDAFTATARLPVNVAIGIVGYLGDVTAAANHDISSISDEAVELIQGDAFRSDLLIKGNNPTGLDFQMADPRDGTPLPMVAFNAEVGNNFTIRGTRRVTGNDFASLYIVYFEYGDKDTRPRQPWLGQPIYVCQNVSYADVVEVEGTANFKVQSRIANAMVRMNLVKFGKRNSATGAVLALGLEYEIGLESSENTDDNLPWNDARAVAAVIGATPLNPNGGIGSGAWNMPLPDQQQIRFNWRDDDATVATKIVNNLVMGYLVPLLRKRK